MKDLSRAIVFIGIFAVPFIPLIIANSMFFPFITGKNFTFRIIVEVIFAAWLILALYEPMYRPRFSWIFAGLAALVGVMFFANALGEYPLKSFWSNFERMDGYVTIVHFFLYTVVLGSVMRTQKVWDRYFNTTIFVAVILAFYAFAQLSGNITINQGGVRLDGTLGNSAYMAVYMLFHVFITALMMVRTQSKNARYIYGGLLVLFIYLLVQTATRGTILGLVGGGFLTTLYIALRAESGKVKKTGITVLASIIILVSGFIAVKDTQFVKDNEILSRIASISLSALEVRFTIWNMALEGVKERPILGWGQGNFNYVFNTYYNPDLYGEEPWFDRVHNIVIDWLIAGGILGAVAYFSVLLAGVVCSSLRPFFKKEEEHFSIAESGILLGLLAGYFVHNLVVFDNIVSYIFYASILAFIHSRVSTEIPQIAAFRIDKNVVTQIAAPVITVILVLSVYVVNVPSIKAATDIIDAFRAQSPNEMVEIFDRALSRGSFADQEIREQMVRRTQNVLDVPDLPESVKNEYVERAKTELLKQAKIKPNDARIHVFISSFYRMIGDGEKAAEQLAIARKLSPNKQQIIFEQGFAALQNGEYEVARDFFKEAYDLQPDYPEARVFYAVGLLYNGQKNDIGDLLDSKYARDVFGRNSFAMSSAERLGAYDLLVDVITTRIEIAPNDVQLRTNLAAAYYALGDVEAAILALETAANDIPEFSQQAEAFIKDLKSGRTPGQPNVEVSGPEETPEAPAAGPVRQ